MLPDESTGQSPGTLAEKLSRCKPARTERYVRAGRGWRAFCCHGTSFITCWRDRGTILIGAGKLSRYRIYFRGTGAVSVQFVSKPEICHGKGFLLRADARIRVQQTLQICLGSRDKSKNRDNLSRIAGNNLPLLSVLWARPCCLSRYQKTVSVQILPFLGLRLSTKFSCYRKFYYLGGRGENF